MSKFSTWLTNFDILKKWPEARKTQNAYKNKVAELEKVLKNGVDIFSEQQITILETDLGIEYGDEERELYEDNCKVDEESKLCKRIRWCAGTDKKWLKKAVERKKRLERKEYIAKKEIERIELN